MTAGNKGDNPGKVMFWFKPNAAGQRASGENILWVSVLPRSPRGHTHEMIMTLGAIGNHRFWCSTVLGREAAEARGPRKERHKTVEARENLMVVVRVGKST